MKVQLPAKLILFGEHSVVYSPHRAVVASVDLPCTVSVNFSEQNEFEFYWRGKLERKQTSRLEQRSITKALEFLEAHLDNYHPRALSIRMEVNAPLNAGLGSSAFTAAGLLVSVCAAYGKSLKMNELETLVHELEAEQHGKASGADTAAILKGGMIMFSRNKEGGQKLKTLASPNQDFPNKELSNHLNKTVLIHTGERETSTKEMVEQVQNTYKKNTTQTEEYFTQIDAIVDRFLELSQNQNCEESEWMELINQNGKILEDLGVVSKPGLELSKKIRAAGGAIKVSGAGAQGNGPCGIMLAYHSNPKIIEDIASEYGLTCFQAKIAGPGLEYQ